MTVSDVSASGLPEYPLARECPHRPGLGTASLREPGPMTKVRLYDGRTAWLVTGAEEARSLLADQRTSVRPHPNFPVLNEELTQMRATREMAVEEEGGFASALFGVDPPEHSRQRQVLVPQFSAKRVARQRPNIQRIVDEQLDAMVREGAPADFITAFAEPVPTKVVCAHLGVPFSEHAAFGEFASKLFDPVDADAAMDGLVAYLDDLVRRKESEPGTGMLDALIAEHVRPGRVERGELVQFALAVLVAGTVTTTSTIALGTLALLDAPGAYAALHADPSLAPGAVEEILRWVSLVEQISRVALEDIELSGRTIEAGDGLLISTAGANWGPDVTSHPEEFDITRPPGRHLSFGHGIHHCLGRNLARMELEVVFETLTRRLPGLRSVMPTAEIPAQHDGTVQKLLCFPVTW
uniref:p450 oxidoreductase n=1 Tax=Actinomadura madurae TaxID=1993 RepID=B0BLN1_9ACTN|nr:P450 oxidoreductase [Actinomadura madurae]